jgi:RimJ/RimL family protein N-acetyltransferase/ubiquinone/menaquinone biosynthesis C-methylase UbiE
MDNYQITFETWNKLASVYQEKFMDIDLYNDTYDNFCSLVDKPNSKILEIGCGPGNITKYTLFKRPDFKITAIDVSANMIKMAKKNNPNADFKVMDCRNLDSISESFDGIICGFCMPYLSKDDCAKLIKDFKIILNSNGIVYFSVIEGEYSKSGFETDSSGLNKAYVYYHQQDYLNELLVKNNFELLQIARKGYTNSKNITENHLIFIAKKTKLMKKETIAFELRPWQLSDIDSLVEHANNPEIAKFMTDGFPSPYTIENAKTFIDFANQKNPVSIFAIAIEGRAVGGIGIHPQADIQRKNAELGYWLSQKYWGKGVVTEAIKQMIDFAFKTYDINRLFARPFGTNTASQRVLEKAGFKLEAKLEKTLFKNGEYLDELIYSVRR